ARKSPSAAKLRHARICPSTKIRPRAAVRYSQKIPLANRTFTDADARCAACGIAAKRCRDNCRVMLLPMRIRVLRYRTYGNWKRCQSVEESCRTNIALVNAAKDIPMAETATNIPVSDFWEGDPDCATYPGRGVSSGGLPEPWSSKVISAPGGRVGVATVGCSR